MAAKIREQIQDMDEELTEYKKSSKQLELKMTGMRLKGEGMRGEIVQQERECSTAEAVLRHIRGNLHECRKYTSQAENPTSSSGDAAATAGTATKTVKISVVSVNNKQLKSRIAAVRCSSNLFLLSATVFSSTSTPLTPSFLHSFSLYYLITHNHTQQHTSFSACTFWRVRRSVVWQQWTCRKSTTASASISKKRWRPTSGRSSTMRKHGATREHVWCT